MRREDREGVMKKILTSAACFAAALGIAAAAGKVFAGKGLQTGAPAMNRYNDQTPESTLPLPRPFAGAPPLIPHTVEGLGVTRATNDCLACHLEGTEIVEGHRATKVPPSHFTNPYKKETKDGEVVGTRYNCLQCHAPQTLGSESPVPQAARR
jgi:cytochrome c-type protein NapB